jgi:glycerophosphoryl diester phosphodiesterase
MRIIAHRGNDGIHGENTAEGILNCLNLDYVDGVEFDIRMTKDFKFVINHDPFYRGYLIRKTRFKVLLQAGISSLEEVLSSMNTNKIILIEIKEETKKYHILIAKLYRLLKKYSLNYYIFSFNYDLMSYFKFKHCSMKCGLLIGIKANVDKINNNLDFNGVNYRHANKSKKESFVWTINGKDEFNFVGKDQGIITDRCEFFSKYEKR